MQKLIFTLFLSIFFLDILNRYGLINRQITWVPDILSVVVLIAVVLLAAKKKVVHIGSFYWIIFLFISMHLLFGVILNQVPLFAIFTGIRTYFKFIPFFLLPAIYTFSDIENSKQLRFLLLLSLLQLPIALYQRFIESKDLLTGDFVRGTLETSGTLSIYLICCVAMLWAFYLKKNLSKKSFFILLPILLIPTMINESKATLILLPIALLIPALITNTGKSMHKRIFGVLLLSILFVAVFVPVYDHFMKPRWGYGIIDFITMEGRVEGYLIRNKQQIEKGHIGKLNSFVFQYKTLSHDPIKLLFGLGMGNVSRSFFGKRFAGEYYEEYGDWLGPSLPRLLWEVGWLGALLVILIFLKISKDAFYLRNKSGIAGTIGLGWCGVMGVFLIAMLYRDTIHSNIVGYLFWYFSGYVAARTLEYKISITNQKTISPPVHQSMR